MKNRQLEHSDCNEQEILSQPLRHNARVCWPFFLCDQRKLSTLRESGLMSVGRITKAFIFFLNRGDAQNALVHAQAESVCRIIWIYNGN